MSAFPPVGEIGRVLGGRYRLVTPIGAGASARVYLADDITLRRRVAVKVLHPGLADDPTFLRRFQAEAQSAASLNSPYVLGVYDWGHDDVAYLVTEYLGGGSLRSLLDAGHRLSPSQALLLGLEGARGLDYAHDRGLVHRDIKPGNLLFGDDGRLRIADFGLARAIAEAGWTDEAGSLVGTARYAAPEQARGERVGPASDIFALALSINESVSGSVPFTNDSVVATLMARTEQPFEPDPDLGPLVSLLRTAGALDPADRPAAGELAEAFLAAASNLPPPAPLPLAGVGVDVDAVLEPTEHGTSHVSPSPLARGAVEETAPARRWPWALLLAAIITLVAATATSAWRSETEPLAVVPDVEGLDRMTAVAELATFGWELDIVDVREANTELDEVVRVDPPPGRALADGETVRLFVSLGEPLVVVPESIGLSITDAADRLTAAGFTVGEISEAADETVASGLVLALVTPGGAVELEPGTVVDLVVSTGPQDRTVPDMVASGDAADAIVQLAALRLTATEVREFDETIPADEIIRYEPPPGTIVPVGTDVVIVVSDGPRPRPVPDVIGLDVADATEILEADGFVVVGVLGSPSLPVLATDPAAGEVRSKGTEIVIATSLTGD
ncbi:MAG: protein kinase domain-containing protein [Acidimicrobiales bacterium]